MKKLAMFAIALAVALVPAVALAQPQPPQKPTVSGYLKEGYDVVHIEGAGGQFIFFILRKDQTLVHCSVLLQSGETSSCRTIK
jgi:hypothetical protein